MSDRAQDGSEHPTLTPDRNVEAGLKDTFPASDPAAATLTQGSRAVPPQDMLRTEADPPPMLPDGGVALGQAFPDAESAKIALETLVREGPVDRRCAAIESRGQGEAVLTFQVSKVDAQRLEALLRKQAGPAN
jgi:hypothetical protein